MNRLFGITLGDSSGVGPEILLKAFVERRIEYPIVVYGDVEALLYYDRLLGYGHATMRNQGTPRRISGRIAERFGCRHTRGRRHHTGTDQ